MCSIVTAEGKAAGWGVGGNGRPNRSLVVEDLEFRTNFAIFFEGQDGYGTTEVICGKQELAIGIKADIGWALAADLLGIEQLDSARGAIDFE
jgi:hypothetical protein